MGLLRWLSGKESACQVGYAGLIPGLGRSPGEGNGNLLQYSCLENPMDRGACRLHSPWGCKELDTTEWLHFHFHRIHMAAMGIKTTVKTRGNGILKSWHLNFIWRLKSYLYFEKYEILHSSFYIEKMRTRRCHDSSKALSKDQRVDGSSIVGKILPFIRIWNQPAHKN